MIFYSLSDVHLEFYNRPKHMERLVRSILSSVTKEEACLLLCGDIGRVDTKYDHDKYRWFLDRLSPRFQKIFLILGNHEFYGSSISKTKEKINKFADDKVVVLCNDVYVLTNEPKPIAIIGTTLWGYCPSLEGQKYVNDFFHISDFKKDPYEYNRLSQKNKNWLIEQITQYHETHDLIVMTHHLPSYELIHPDYRDQYLLNPYYAQDLDKDILTIFPISVWVYGHTHQPSIRVMHHTRFVCNPIGYPEEGNPKRAQEISVG